MGHARSSPSLRRLALAVPALSILLIASCDEPTRTIDYRDCDDVVRSCRTVCNYWCDRWGCYPMCWDQCWDQCFRYPDPPPSEAPPATDASAPDASPSEAPPDAGAGLCVACTSNRDCADGALCIVRGGPPPDAAADAGPPSGVGFCGQACGPSADCPEGFACTSLGASRQCLPTSGACD